MVLNRWLVVLSVFLSGTLAQAQPQTAAQLTAAEVRAALVSERKLVLSKPQDVKAHITLAYTLMDAGLGEEAWEEGRQATLADPQSSFAFSAYAWLLRHNALGEDFGRGYAYEASQTAYLKAIELDPDDLSVRQSLAENLRYDRFGLEYGPTADMNHSIEALRYIQARQRPLEPDVVNDLAIELVQTERYKEALEQVRSYPATPTLDGVALTAVAALEGAPAAISLADRMTGNSERRRAALGLAYGALMDHRLYPQSAALLKAAQPETGESDEDRQKIRLLQTLVPYRASAVAADDPTWPLKQLLSGSLGHTLTEQSYAGLFSQHAFVSEAERQANVRQFNLITATNSNAIQQYGLPPAVFADIAMAALQLRAKPQGGKGAARVDGQSQLGSAAIHAYVVKEEGSYRIVAESHDFAPVGEEALFFLQQGDLEDAGAVLDWKLTFSEKTDDDPLGGTLLARLWALGQNRDAESIEVAAATLLTEDRDGARLLPDLLSFRAKATGSRKDMLGLTIAYIDLSLGDGAASEAETQVLLSRYANSPTAVRLAGRAYTLTRNWLAWKALLARHLAADPDEPELLRQQAAEQEAEGRFTEARKTYQTLITGGKGTLEDKNLYAWLSVFSGQIDPSATVAGEEAIDSKTPVFSSLQTVGCLYALQGKAPEARQTLLRAMTAGHLLEPDGNIWVGFGLLYEQYGEKQAAIAAFKRVLRENSTNPIDSYALAQIHLKALSR